MVAPSEPLARYLTRHKHFNIPTNSVKPAAFYPSPPTDLQLSVYRVEGLSDDAVWGIGQTDVIERMPPPRRTLYGIASIKALVIQSMNLCVVPDDNPPRHANIIGWPQEKPKWKSVAQELAARANLKLRP